LLAGIVGADRADWTAHALLSATRADLIDHLLSAEGWSGERVREQLGRFVDQVLGPEPA
jgi:hypothetical protein